MPKTLTEVAQDAAELAPTDRLKLARILLQLSSDETASTEDLQTAWDEEIERRLEELRSGKAKGVLLEEVKERIERGFRS
jgi:putative addiction module component (TIGR02574 family)